MIRCLLLALLLFMPFVQADEGVNIKSDILILSTNMGKNRQERKAELLKEQLAPYSISSEIIFNLDEDKARETFKDRRLVIIDALDGKHGVASLLRRYEDILEDTKTPYIALKLEYKKFGNMDEEFASTILDYFSQAGKYNYAQGAAFLARAYFSTQTNPQPVHKMSNTGIYHPNKGKGTFENLDEYWKTLSDDEKNSPMVGIVIHKENISSDDTVIVDTAIKQLTSAGITPIVFTQKVGEEDFAGERFFTKDGKQLIDLIISFQVMIMDQEQLRKDYARIGLKVMHGVIYRQGSQEVWEKDKQGISMSWIPMTYTIPEHIGYTDQLIVGALDPITKKTIPISYQLDMFMKIAINNSKLKQKQNKEKNIAIFYYNYPPGVNNFGASYMQFPESLSSILSSMKEAGYQTQSESSDYFIKTLPKSMAYYYKDSVYNEKYADLLSYDTYYEWYLTLPQETRNQINKKWGHPRKSKFLHTKDGKKYFIIPRLKKGKVTLLPQPSRSNIGQDRMGRKIYEGRIYHDTASPVPHHYLAVYLYVRQQNDAIVHLGTHGTYEWTYGKERGLSIYDSPLLSVGELPNIYPYITNNLAEGIQAKRRGRATLISHQTPPFGVSGTYKELSDIMDLINQYKQSSDAVKQNNKKQLIA